jgi:hypothetical protein
VKLASLAWFRSELNAAIARGTLGTDYVGLSHAGKAIMISGLAAA